jgi:arabinofuranan 3-O-arabinosyltransferase
VDAPDSELDRLAGLSGPVAFESSGRFHNEFRFRASSAFDGDPDTAWVGIWARPSSPYPWISWRSSRPQTVRRLRMSFLGGRVRRPTRVRLSWPGGETPPLPVAADGTVELPAPARARSFRLTLLDTEPGPEGTTRAVGIASLEVPGVASVEPARSGPIRARCGDAAVSVDDRTGPLRPQGTIADLEAGRPLRARACSGEVAMGDGVQRIRSLPAAFSVHLLRMHSPAPDPPPPATAAGTRVVDTGELGHSSVEGVRVDFDAPGWLVLGQSYSEGWRATCDGRSLGEPTPINGYANGWRAPAGCREVEFEFAPQSGVRVGYAISGVVCALLLAFLLAGWVLMRRRPEPAPAVPAALPEDRPRPLPLPRAALLALAFTIPLALLFAARTSVVLFPLLTLILWRGVGSRLLTLVAAGLLGIVVPILYLVLTPRDRGGFNFEYSTELIAPHWVAVGAVVLLMAACWRMLAAARGAR